LKPNNCNFNFQNQIPMSKDFFDKPFEEETLTKLELYKNYVEKWLPVFIVKPKLVASNVNVFDFFAGAGRDIEGTEGSPIIAINVATSYQQLIVRPDLKLSIYFNDYEIDICKKLKNNIDALDFDRNNINVHISQEDFRVAFDRLKPKMKNAANLLFLDQFGVKFVTPKLFLEIVDMPMTDMLFFISSSTFNRFAEHENVKKVLEISREEIKNRPFSHIHKVVLEKYRTLIPEGKEYYLVPFSIKRGANIYGLIFGSGHLLGLQKFLEVCWKKDTLTGEANFDMEGEQIDPTRPRLFAAMNIPKKVDLFKKDLKDKILNKELQSDRDIYLHIITNGFIGQHAREVLKELKGEIECKNPSFNYRTVMKKNRLPSTIKITK